MLLCCVPQSTATLGPARRWEVRRAHVVRHCQTSKGVFVYIPVTKSICGYSLEQAQVVGIVGIVGMVGMVGIVGINK